MSREFYAHQRKEKRKTYILVTLAKSSKCKSTRKTTQPNTGKDRVPSMVVDGLIGGGFDGFDLHLLGRSIWLVTGFDRFRLLGRSVWSVAFARFDHLIIWSVDRLMGLIFFHMGLIHMVLVSLFWSSVLMGLLGFKNTHAFEHLGGAVDWCSVGGGARYREKDWWFILRWRSFWVDDWY